MLTPLINGSIFLFLFAIFGPGIFALGYWSLRSRDKEDRRLGAKSLLAYLEALTMQAALASAALSSLLTVPISVAPMARAHWHAISPTPPAAA